MPEQELTEQERIKLEAEKKELLNHMAVALQQGRNDHSVLDGNKIAVINQKLGKNKKPICS